MQIALWVYVLIGVVPWAAFCAALIITRSRMRRLFRNPPPLPQPPPHVTIVTPAKDEADHIESCVCGLLRQDYPQFHVRVIDDRSTDGTGEILDRLAGKQSLPPQSQNLSVRHIRELPPGWLGKCHALYEGTRDLESPWLLFVDSDVSIEPAALSRTLATAASRGYDAVSLLPRLDARSFLERLMIPVCGSAWSVMFLMQWTNEDSRPNHALANGQYFLIRREAYERVGGHKGVRHQIVEDVELMRSLKAAGFRCRILAAPNLVATRMHSTIAELRSGWGRIFAGTARFRRAPLYAAIVFIMVCGLSVYPMLAVGAIRASGSNDHRFLAAAAGHWLLMTMFLGYIYAAVRVRVPYALLPIMSFPLLIGLLWRGIQRCGDRKFEWRGTAVEIERS